jgi:hypothetical protein
MTNRFDIRLHPERSVDEIVPKLSVAELEQVIKLVGRSPRVYPPGTLDALKQRRALVSPEPPQRSGNGGHSNVSAHKQHPGAATDPDQMRRAHEHKLAMLRAHTAPAAGR